MASPLSCLPQAQVAAEVIMKIFQGNANLWDKCLFFTGNSLLITSLGVSGILFCFGFYFLGRKTRHAELPRPGTEPCPLQWKYGVLTTGPPGKSLWHIFIKGGSSF